MNEKQAAASITYSKMENLIIPYKTVQWIKNNFPASDKVLKDRKNHFIRQHLKEWNQMNNFEKKEQELVWAEEAVIIEYLTQKDLIKDGVSNIETLWSSNEEGDVLACDVRLYFTNTGVELNKNIIRFNEKDTKKES